MRDYGQNCCWESKEIANFLFYECYDENLYIYFGMVICIKDDEKL
jgi:hypothetical protein